VDAYIEAEQWDGTENSLKKIQDLILKRTVSISKDFKDILILEGE